MLREEIQIDESCQGGGPIYRHVYSTTFTVKIDSSCRVGRHPSSRHQTTWWRTTWLSSQLQCNLGFESRVKHKWMTFRAKRTPPSIFLRNVPSCLLCHVPSKQKTTMIMSKGEKILNVLSTSTPNVCSCDKPVSDGNIQLIRPSTIESGMWFILL